MYYLRYSHAKLTHFPIISKLFFNYFHFNRIVETRHATSLQICPKLHAENRRYNLKCPTYNLQRSTYNLRRPTSFHLNTPIVETLRATSLQIASPAKLAPAIVLIIEPVFLKQCPAPFAQPVFSPVFLPKSNSRELCGSPMSRLSNLFQAFPTGRA